MANIELPKDAEGREIPLDTSELFISDGTMVHVLRFEYMHHTHDAHDAWFVYIERTPGEHMTLHACDVHLTPPDSWEKLEEDLDRAAKAEAFRACRYANDKMRPCNECRFLNKKGLRFCDGKALAEILDRIHKLRGED